jgi:glycosyltransferase involved in cell wall biosynthesis
VIQGEVTTSASIVCPVFNMAGRLELLEGWIQAVSLHPRIEIIIVLDVSDEATRNELDKICQKHKNIKFTEGYFGNPGSARNAGLELCQGKWVVFWDSDDEPNVENFLASIKSIEETNSDLFFGRYKVFHEGSRSLFDSPAWTFDTQINLSIVAQNPGIWRIIFSRELIDGLRFNPLRMAEDQIFICEAILKAKTITFADSQIYTYFTGSLNHLTRNPEALQDLLPAFIKTSELIHGKSLELRPFLYLMAARQLISGSRYGNMRSRYGLMVALIKTKLFISPMFLISLHKAIQKSIRGA